MSGDSERVTGKPEVTLSQQTVVQETSPTRLLAGRSAARFTITVIYRSDIKSFVRGDYSFSDTGSDSFFGDFLSNKETSSRPEAGMPTLPSRTISLAVGLRPYSFLFALPSDRSVEPSSEIPANKPRERE